MRGGKCRPTALCHFIKRLNKRAASNHDYLKVKGWWQRNSRLIYNPPLSKVESIGPYLPKLQPILIIGKTGTLGRAFSKICAQRALPYVLIGRKECDIAEPDQVDAMIENITQMLSSSYQKEMGKNLSPYIVQTDDGTGIIEMST
jgi:dTDP-4-dehydrorhamnose reductase